MGSPPRGVTSALVQTLRKEIADLFVCPGDLVDQMQRKVIPADNSCLFNAVRHCLQLTMSPQDIRRLCAQAVLADAELYCEAVLDKPPKEYASWIQRDESWGGAIEVGILA